MKKKNSSLPVIDDCESKDSERYLCPSFSPKKPGVGWVFGIIAGEPGKTQVVPLEKPEPVTEETFELTAPFHPSQVLRMAAPCMEGRCKNFGEGACHLAKTVASRAADDTTLPPCKIRPRCLWWKQEGGEACKKCPELVTNNAATWKERVGM